MAMDLNNVFIAIIFTISIVLIILTVFLHFKIKKIEAQNIGLKNAEHKLFKDKIESIEHGIKTPITIVRGHIHLLQRTPVSTMEEVKNSSYQEIATAIARLKKDIDNYSL